MIEFEGTEYSLEGTDGVDLEEVFKRSVATTLNQEDSFVANIVAYHTNERFRTLVDDKKDEIGIMMLIACSGPTGVKDLIDAARAHNVAGAGRGAVKRQRAWTSTISEVVFSQGWDAMETYYAENKESLWEKYKVPNDARKDTFAEVAASTGKGSWSRSVADYNGVSAATGEACQGKISIVLRLDANNKGRAKKAQASNGVDAESHEATA